MRRREFVGAGLTWLAGAGALGCAGPQLLRDRSSSFVALDGVAQAALAASGEIRPSELVEAAMRRIAAVDPALNAVVTRAFDRALGRVVQAPVGGPFGGVPYLLKDLTEWEGVRCTHGSRLFLDHVSEASAPLVERSETAGLVVLGKTNTPEFGLLPSTESIALGPCRNPWDPAASTGGSSGGAAAAVAAGLVPLAEAGDGGGSIRIPASCCGVFGLKPSRGRVGAGDPADADDITVKHCISRSVRDSARLLAVTEQQGPAAAFSPVGEVSGPSSRRLRMAVSSQSALGTEPDADVRAAWETAVALCRELGHEVVERAPELDGHRFIEHFLTRWAAGPARVVEDVTGRGIDPEAVLEPWTLGLAADFRRQPLGALAQAIAFFEDVTRRVDAFFSDVDVWLTPVLTRPAPRLGELAPDVPFETLRERCIQLVGYTPLHNVAGTPAMSVPLAWSPSGLPIGMQFAAARGDEATLLALAYELEAAAPWADRWPALRAVGV